MKLVALVSGGKDSCYNILLCQQLGHEVVALANLLPKADDVDELDSYMYQTVGHQLVAAYAECAGLPLIRRRIQGSAKQQGMAYEATAEDEVEDMLALLAFAKEQYPDIQAVSSGAIASDYQRLRVEHVCARLGLTSLAFMWQQPQADLLQGMIDAGIQAVLVKVAAMGLQPHQHLGKTLQQMQPLLHKLRGLYGCNVCGEGGEYETLTLDCPLFTCARIVLDDWTVVLHSPDVVAPVGVLHPTAFHVESKGAAHNTGAARGGQPHAAALSRAVVVDVPADYVAVGGAAKAEMPTTRPQQHQLECQLCVKCQRSRRYTQVSCTVTLPQGSKLSPQATQDAVQAALDAATAELAGLQLWLADALFVHLYLADMEHFAAANAAYCCHFPGVSPAARACVQLPLPADMAVAIDVLLPSAVEGDRDRRVVHVQSISSWAPSCIGPYSQATSCHGLIHMAGQIALDPATMQLVPGGVREQTQRCLESCQAVAVAMHSDLRHAMLSCTIYTSPQAGEQGPKIALDCCKAFTNGVMAPSKRRDEVECHRAADIADTASDDSRDEAQRESDGAPVLDDYLRPPAFPDPTRCFDPLFATLVVPALPRGALVELQLLAYTAQSAAGKLTACDNDTDVDAPAAVNGMRRGAAVNEHAQLDAAEGVESDSGSDVIEAMQSLQTSSLSAGRQLMNFGSLIAVRSEGCIPLGSDLLLSETGYQCVRGQFVQLRTLAYITAHAIASSGSQAVRHDQLLRCCRGLAESAVHALHTAGLSLRSVCSVRVSYVPQLMDAAVLARAFEGQWQDVLTSRGNASSGSAVPAVVYVPVLRMGLGMQHPSQSPASLQPGLAILQVELLGMG